MNCIFDLNSTSGQTTSETQILGHAVKKSGSFLRRSDGLIIQRYFCKTCRKSFSTESRSDYKYQKKRLINDLIFTLFASAMSQRRMAKVLSVNPKTIVRKFTLLGQICLRDMKQHKHLPGRKINTFCFDDMETFEHTKMKPLSITLAVEDPSRLILDFRVSTMKAKGHLSEEARKKYGHRVDTRKQNLAELLKSVKTITTHNPIIKSDMSPHYGIPVSTYFPESTHHVFKGRKGCVIGQGELKAVGFDPLFSLNHTAAMLRANLNRLFRRTWNTTKKEICLRYHIAIYIFYHNLRLIDQSTFQKTQLKGAIYIRYISIFKTNPKPKWQHKY